MCFICWSAPAIAVTVLYLPSAVVEWVLVIFSVVAVLLEVARAHLTSVNDLVLRYVPFFKPSERYVVTGGTFLVLASTAAFFAFEKEVVVLAPLFLAVGDPLAALVGTRDHRLRIFASPFSERPPSPPAL